MIEGTPIEIYLQMMEKYIYLVRGKLVTIKPPTTVKEIELFEKMINGNTKS